MYKKKNRVTAKCCWVPSIISSYKADRKYNGMLHEWVLKCRNESAFMWMPNLKGFPQSIYWDMTFTIMDHKDRLTDRPVQYANMLNLQCVPLYESLLLCFSYSEQKPGIIESHLIYFLPYKVMSKSWFPISLNKVILRCFLLKYVCHDQHGNKRQGTHEANN